MIHTPATPIHGKRGKKKTNNAKKHTQKITSFSVARKPTVATVVNLV